MRKLDRRNIIAGAAVGAAATTLAAPAIAQTQPELRWRLASGFPKSLDTIYGAAEIFARAVAEATDNRFQIQVFGGGELVPALQTLDPTANGTIEITHTASYYFWGKDPTFAFGTTIPFGMNMRMQQAWWYEGGADKLMNEFYAKHNVIAFLAGNTGVQMGGWFRKEINTPEDLKGLKFRLGGFGGRIIAKVGVVPQQIAGGDIYPALERGTIDGAEWVGPHDDEKLGFYKVARFYYYPGWWEGGAMLHNMINLDAWNKLPSSYQAAIRQASAIANNAMIAKYDALNPIALKRLVAAGTQLRPFPEPVLDACFKAATETYDEISGQNADFKKVYEHMRAFRSDGYLWVQLAENTFDTYMMIQQRKRAI